MVPNTLPTDNLYKFATVGGIIMICFGLAYPPYANQQAFQEYTNLLNQTNQVLRESQLQMHRDPNSMKPLNEKEVDFVQGITVGEIANLEIWMNQKKQYLEQVESKTKVCFWIGSLIFPLFIFLWWFQHQRHQDLLLQAESVVARKKIAEVAKIAGTRDKGQK